jgi:hypothetical protein
MTDLLPGTEIAARGLRWELVYTPNLGAQTLHRLRGIEGHFAGLEMDLLAPFDEITPVFRDLRPEHPAQFHAYGRLTRDQYAHVLSTFSHTSYKDAPRQCLAAFDELQSLGLESVTKKRDPYWDILLNENLPQPMIDKTRHNSKRIQ